MAQQKRATIAAPRLADRHRAQRTELVRNEIVEAAIAEFTERGYHEASLTQIAERIGTGPSTIYNYFTSKREILEQAVAATLSAVTNLLGRAVAEPPRSVAEFHDRANQFGDVLIDLFTEDPRIARMLLVISTSSDPVLREQWTALYQFATSVVENFLAEAAAAGFLRPDLDARSTAVSIIAIPFGIIACDPTAPTTDHAQAEALVRATVAMVTSGIRSHQDSTADTA